MARPSCFAFHTFDVAAALPPIDEADDARLLKVHRMGGPNLTGSWAPRTHMPRMPFLRHAPFRCAGVTPDRPSAAAADSRAVSRGASTVDRPNTSSPASTGVLFGAGPPPFNLVRQARDRAGAYLLTHLEKGTSRTGRGDRGRSCHDLRDHRSAGGGARRLLDPDGNAALLERAATVTRPLTGVDPSRLVLACR